MKLDLLFYMTSSENRLVNSQLYTVIFFKKNKKTTYQISHLICKYIHLYLKHEVNFFLKKEKSHVQCKEPQRITIT